MDVLDELSIAKLSRCPSGPVTVCAARSMAMRAPGLCCRLSRKAATRSAGSTTGKSPFCKLLLKKMSPKLGAITARMP